MQNQAYILAIDSGTQSVRALIFDLRGNLVAGVRVPIEAYTSPRPGWAEQDPEYFSRQLFGHSDLLVVHRVSSTPWGLTIA